MLTVTSSSLLYLNVLAFFLCGTLEVYGVVSYDSYAQPFVFGLNVDVILNCVGMLLVAGYFNDVPLPTLFKMTSLWPPSSKPLKTHPVNVVQL